MLSVLICCESSGIVSEAFRAQGCDAYSCDLLPAEDNSPHHFEGDCREIIKACDWDLIGLHPPCTNLCVSGLHWNDRGRGWEGTNDALGFVAELMMLAEPAPWYIENPVSIISTQFWKPTQIIQPYDFGEDASKKTCLWLSRLPKLQPTERFPGRIVTHNGKRIERWSNQTDSGQNKLPPSNLRWKERARTYPGVANAMASQWTDFLKASCHRKPTLAKSQPVGLI